MPLAEQSTKPATAPAAAKPADRRKMVGRLGPWRLVRLMGEGALNRVYLAEHEDAPGAACYAIKTLKKEWWNDTGAIELQRREALVGRKVSHPNLLPVLAAHVAAPPFYVVTPRIVGQSLQALLQGGRPRLPQALWIARQAAEALAALHQQTGMIHGDVKPSNVLVGPDGHATLLDLGFCQSANETRAWSARPVMGTLSYIAPERVTSACGADARSDLYSLGVMLYEMIAGRLPLEADEPARLIEMHRQAKPECIRSVRPDLPKPVASLVHRLLAKEALRRPDSAAAVARELVRLEIACFSLT
ncbi:Serine/threonine-protein kinase PrkC [Pirellulimonas nuda]|uniref:Serine/threonine-protein kinase PrkC n=1 Tax=Pirellulimonas nuda TaxID=2528009 RepID=A0A518DGF4_9BACT|nr:serine/threonine-protein kinase [Pirellulimonas nuda]QDU90563.1 Serine/threonine-protein kinase PrkC [Pirellulimonas nuda]